MSELSLARAFLRRPARIGAIGEIEPDVVPRAVNRQLKASIGTEVTRRPNNV